LRLFLSLAFASAIFVNPLAAQTNIPSTLSSNRFLFVLDTSAAMKKKLPEMLAAVDQILGSSASGQLREGDTLGLWTFNQDVYAKFPLQTWGRIGSGDISLLIHSFMQHQRFTNSINLDKTLREMFGVMSVSDIITVVLIYGGEEPIKGTPFDMQINRFLKANVKASKGKGVPAVVVLESKGGAAFDYAVSASPWPVEIPPIPQPPPPEPKPAPPAVTETVKPPAPVAKLPPLILSGPQSTRTAPPPVPAPPVPVVTAEKTVTPAPVVNSPPAAAPEPVSPPSALPEPAFTPVPPPTAATPAPEPTAKISLAPSNETATPVSTSTVAVAPEPAATPLPGPAPLAQAVLPVTTRPVGYLIAGLVLAVVAIALIILMLKGSRQKGGPSFISRSISEKK
jgi:hypothetical protein